MVMAFWVWYGKRWSIFRARYAQAKAANITAVDPCVRFVSTPATCIEDERGLGLDSVVDVRFSV